MALLGSAKDDDEAIIQVVATPPTDSEKAYSKGVLSEKQEEDLRNRFSDLTRGTTPENLCVSLDALVSVASLKLVPKLASVVANDENKAVVWGRYKAAAHMINVPSVLSSSESLKSYGTRTCDELVLCVRQLKKWINKIRNGTKGKRKTKRKLVVPNIIFYLEQSGEFADPQMLQIMLGIVGVLANMCSVAYVDRKLLYRYTCLSLLCFSYLFNSLPGTGGCTKNYAWNLRH